MLRIRPQGHLPRGHLGPSLSSALTSLSVACSSPAEVGGERSKAQLDPGEQRDGCGWRVGWGHSWEAEHHLRGALELPSSAVCPRVWLPLARGGTAGRRNPSSGCSSRLPEARVLQSPWWCVVACGSTHVGVEGPALLASSHPQGLPVPAVRTAPHQAPCQHPLPGPTRDVMLPSLLHPSFEVAATGPAGRHGHQEGTPGPLGPAARLTASVSLGMVATKVRLEPQGLQPSGIEHQDAARAA